MLHCKNLSKLILTCAIAPVWWADSGNLVAMLLTTGPLPKTYVFPSVSTTPLQTSPVGGGAPHTPFDTQVDAPVVPELMTTPESLTNYNCS